MKTVEIDVRWAGVAGLVYLLLGCASYEKAWKFGAACIITAAIICGAAWLVKRCVPSA